MNLMHGYYKVGQKQFAYKIMALIEASKTNESVEWIFHDNVWDHAFKTIKPNLNLDQLYKQRAQQLRDQYDYLICSYSGGSDSWTIVNTFLKHNIFLDEIYIRWPMKAIKGSKIIYTPNTNDRSAANSLSEWDFVIEKDIEIFKEKSPKTKITIYDWTEDVNSEILESEFFVTNHFLSLWNIKRFVTQGNLETKMLDSGKKVGVIFGIDKPILKYYNNGLHMNFIDHMVALAFSDGWKESKVEYFYWTPDMPEIVVSQCKKIFDWIKSKPAALEIIKKSNTWLNDRLYNDMIKSICFPEYDLNKFQVDKPTSILYSEKEEWAFKLPEYERAIDKWKWHSDQYFKLINPNLLDVRDNVIHGLRPIRSRSYHVGDINIFS